MKNVTIKDIAKKAGVSIATVSRVVNNNYYVSEEIKQKVLRSIEELNYYPNSIARSLKNDVTYIIGFVVSDIGNSYFTTIAKALEDAVSTQGYNIIVCSTDGSEERERKYLDLLMSRKVDGLVINTTGKNDKFLTEISKQLAVVLINRKVEYSSFIGDFIDSNNYEGGYSLASHLLSLGHEKIGIINGDLKVSTGRERFEGVKRAILEAGVKLPEKHEYRYDGNFTSMSGYKGAEYITNLSKPPTAMIAMNNEMAIGALKYLSTHQISIPDQVSIASYGNIDNMELLYVKPSYVTLNPWVIGNKAGQLLIERIQDREIHNREIIYTPQLIVGDGVKQI